MKKEIYVKNIVVGGGHAGIEATFAIANKGQKVTLITLDQKRLALMPCNPAIGGPAKGILTREIDALGGMQGMLSDLAMIQIKMLNESRGPAVRALRAQIDKDLYSEITLQKAIDNPNINIIEDIVDEILVENKVIIGLKTESGLVIKCKNIVLTTGTYMNSYVLRGAQRDFSGPDGQKTTLGLSQSLKEMGFTLQRLKTGTPPRVATASIDFSEVEKENLDLNDFSFSNRSHKKLSEQISCYLTYTNVETHKIVFDNINKSSMYSGAINGVGPRYCPSIEDKIVRFSHKLRHQIFYEPETRKGDVIYVNGLSTSMPIDVQSKMLKTLPGMKNARVLKWGYAIEYDAIDPLDIQPSLETKKIAGLFFAGQINGTSGYEEAAAQGLIAGINVALKNENQIPLILQRDQAYIGVLIDDLVTKGTSEPYRMLTSRAEYRLILRNDNADLRLSGIGHKIGLVSQKEHEQIQRKYAMIDQEIDRLKNTYISSKSEIAQKYNIQNGCSYYHLISRPNIDLKDISDFKFIYEVYVNARLGGYIKKQLTDINKLKRLENYEIPSGINYQEVFNIATEAKQKLERIRPLTIGQASRISGINPSDVHMLMFYIENKKKIKYG